MTPKTKKIYKKIYLEDESFGYSFTYNERETKLINNYVDSGGNIDIYFLRRVALWKMDRVLEISDDVIHLLSKIAGNKTVSIKDTIIRDVIERLVNSMGVGYPLASTILKFINPKVFPIIDVRAYRAAFGIKLYSSTYTFEKYIEYAEYVKKISELKKIPFNEVDEQLYAWDKKNNEKI